MCKKYGIFESFSTKANAFVTTKPMRIFMAVLTFVGFVFAVAVVVKLYPEIKDNTEALFIVGFFLLMALWPFLGRVKELFDPS